MKNQINMIQRKETNKALITDLKEVGIYTPSDKIIQNNLLKI